MKLTLNDHVYDVLKWICILLIPAIATLTAALGSIWGHDMTKVVETMTAIDTFLGAILGISCYTYNKENE